MLAFPGAGARLQVVASGAAAAAAALFVIARKAFAERDESLLKLRRRIDTLENRLEVNQEMTTIFDGMNNLIETFTETRDLDAVLNQAAEILRKVLQVDVLTLELYSTEESRIVRHIVMPQGVELEFDQELHEDVVEGGASKLINHLSAVRRYGVIREQGFGSLVAAPLARLLPGGRKESIGYVCGLCRKRKDFGDRDLSLLIAFARQAGLIIENAHLFDKTRHLARTDGLTNLVNHRRFGELLDVEIRRSRESDTPLTLVMGDIDDFKLYNDAHGHLQGDMALRDLAEIMRRSTRGADTVGRYGGEEFVIILPNTDAEGGRLVAENMRRRIEEHKFPGQETQPGENFTITFGLATLPIHARDSNSLIETADRALYAGKRAGKNTTVTAEAEPTPAAEEKSEPARG